MKRRWAWVTVLAAVLLTMIPPASARAVRHHHRHRVLRHYAARRPPRDLYRPRSIPEEPPGGPYASALLVDAETGRALFEKDSSRPWPPASMVKMMTALIALEALRAGEIRLDQPVRVSEAASHTGGSRVFLTSGEVLPFDELLTAMLIASANDASVAVAETVAGSTEEMVARMNRRARELGMTDTIYHSVNGLPPRKRRGLPDMTSASDLAILARKLLEFPEVLHYSAQSEAPFRNGTVRLHNTNHLVGRMPDVDGLKTGYYRRAGFNLTATAARDGMRLVAIVLGCPTLRSRFMLAGDLLEWGFANFSKLEIVRAGEPLSVEVAVANGASPTVRPVAAEGVSMLIRKGERRDLQVRLQMPSVIAAPIAKDQLLGEIIIHDADRIFDVVPAVSPLDVTSNPLLPEAAASQ